MDTSDITRVACSLIERPQPAYPTRVACATCRAHRVDDSGGARFRSCAKFLIPLNTVDGCFWGHPIDEAGQ